MRIATLEYAFVVLDGAGERALAMSEQLGLDQRLGKLREVDGNEAVGEIRREAPLLRQKRDEFRAADGGRCVAFAGAGFTEQQR